MLPVKRISVVYDAECGLCTRVKDWIARQRHAVSIEFVASGSPEAVARFPQLPPGELAVVAGTGEVWLGNGAWIVCLWALADYRDLAIRLTGPLLLPVAREAFSLLSSNRAALSSMLGLRSDTALEQHLRKVVAPACVAAPQ